MSNTECRIDFRIKIRNMDTIIVHPNGPIKSKIRFYWTIGKIFIPVNVFEYDCRRLKYAKIQK